MKKRIQTAIIFVAMVCLSLSGCNESEAIPTSTSPTEPTVRAPVATALTETEDTKTMVTTTAVIESTTELIEAVSKTTVTVPTTEVLKAETEQSQLQVQTECYEPTELAERIITDDTKLTHTEFSTEETMQRLTSELNAHYAKTGMTLDTRLNINNCGWMFAYQGEIDKTSVRSYSEHWDRIVIGMDEQIAALNALSGVTSFEGIRFHYYAELQADGEYHIYYCYQ